MLRNILAEIRRKSVMLVRFWLVHTANCRRRRTSLLVQRDSLVRDVGCWYHEIVSTYNFLPKPIREALVKIPVPLKIVVVYFLFSGIYRLILVIFRVIEYGSFGLFSLLAPVIYIMISYKLLMLQPRWRTFALFLILAGILFTVGFMLVEISGVSSIFSDQVQELLFNSSAFSFVVKILVSIFLYWQYQVLTRGDIIKLFGH